MTRVSVRPELLRWARERSRVELPALERKFPKLKEWESGETAPTLKQLDSFARATYAPVGYLFLQQPPFESIPIPDFRTIANQEIGKPSPNLLDTIYICQDRQQWYKEFMQSTQELPLAFPGSMTVATPITHAAEVIRSTMGIDLDARRNCPTWTEALRMFIAKADASGILVMCSGVVLNNNRRHLDPKEFRGFALADDRAPLIFVNGADSKSAQMFTLAHEIAHIWLGSTALSDVAVNTKSNIEAERWCNQVAAEILIPLTSVRDELAFNPDAPLLELIKKLTRTFKVSSLVVLIRLFDAGYLNSDAFRKAYDDEVARLSDLPRPGGGGDFYLTTAARVSKRFARALLESTFEGRTLYRDAFRMLGISKITTFQDLGKSLHFSN